ncbi:MAG: HEAT repeat domain-containing protein [Planctomycetes bacterium]|nr:HEAT repeat domain-containing protein [Planctomycetota bacterium]
MPRKMMCIEKHSLLALIGLLLLGTTSTTAQEPAAPPDLTAEIDFERKGEYHLGPTGAKGWLHVNERFMTDEARQILITEIQEGTPAEGVLEVGDVILGVGGEHFDDDARKCFGRAIDEAEKNENQGVLKVIRWRPDADAPTRQGKEETVELRLPVMGAYSDTAPYNCPKTEKILQDALAVLVEQESWGRIEVKALAFLATGEDKYIQLVRDFLHEAKWASPEVKLSTESGGLVCWGAGYRGLILTEYYLATGDKYVLPAIREHAVKIAMGQSNGGTWGHGFAWTSQNNGQLHGRLGGYGALNQAGLPCLLTLVLAKKCGVEHPEIDDAIGHATRFFAQFTGNGSIGYGFHRPSLEIHCNGRNGMSGNGKNGIAAVMFSIQKRPQDAQFFSKLTASLYKTCEYGHSGNSYSYFWDPLGANCGGPATAAAFLEELRWYYALTRQADGSFAFQRLGGHYGGEFLDPTVAQVLIATLPRKAIHLTGKGHDRSVWLDEKETTDTIATGRWRFPDTSDISPEELIAGLDNWSPIAREWIAKALAEKDGDFIPRLVEMSKSDNPEARAGAITALGYQGGRAARAVPIVSGALSDEAPIVRIAAGYALTRMEEPARRAVPDLLRAVLAEHEEERMRPTQQALAYSLGYAAGKYAPLYFDGLLPQRVDDEDALADLDRPLLYASVDKLLKDPSGRVRGCGAYALRFFTREDTAIMAQSIYDAVKFSSPNYMMFDDDARQHGLDLMARLGIAEGIPLCFETLDANRWGQGVRGAHRLKTFKQYAGSARSILPRLREMRWSVRTGEHRQLLEDAIRAIQQDKHPRPLVSIHSLVDERLAADLSSITDDRQRVRRCRELIGGNTDDYFYKAAALRQLVSVLGAHAMGDVVAAVGHPNDILHGTAVKLGAELPGETVTDAWVEQLGKARGKKLAGILDVLARRGDTKSLDAIKTYVDHDDESVRIAAVDAVRVLGGAAETPLLVQVLVKAGSEQERAAAEQALIAVCEGTQIAKPLLATLPETTEAARCSVIRVLGQLDDKKALDAVIVAVRDENADVVKAAFEALATSPDPRATDVLLDLAETESNSRVKNEAVMGCLRRVVTDRVASGRKPSLLKKLMAINTNARNASAVLGEFQWSPSVDSLRMAQSCLDDKSLTETAATVVVAIAGQLDMMSDTPQRHFVIEVVERVLEATENEDTAAAAREFLEQQRGS